MNNRIDDLSSISGMSPTLLANDIFNQYAERLLGVARTRLGARLREKVSEEDIVQSAFISFFRRQNEFQFSGDDSDGLWGLLVIITVRKCTKWAAVFGTNKRSISREVSMNDDLVDHRRMMELATDDPSPEEALLLTELVDRLMGQFGERQQMMISLRMQGYELDEIANETQSSRRTVARVIAEAKEVLSTLLTEGDSKSPS